MRRARVETVCARAAHQGPQHGRSTHTLADLLHVMRLRGPYRLLATLVLVIAVWVGWNPDARFESSDAQWWDSTMNFKERRFEIIKSEFDDYRAECQRPDVRLLRTTPMQAWNIGAWPFYLLKKQWRVPFSGGELCQVGRRCPMTGGSIDCGRSANQRLERP